MTIAKERAREKICEAITDSAIGEASSFYASDRSRRESTDRLAFWKAFVLIMVAPVECLTRSDI